MSLKIAEKVVKSAHFIKTQRQIEQTNFNTRFSL